MGNWWDTFEALGFQQYMILVFLHVVYTPLNIGDGLGILVKCMILSILMDPSKLIYEIYLTTFIRNKTLKHLFKSLKNIWLWKYQRSVCHQDYKTEWVNSNTYVEPLIQKYQQQKIWLLYNMLSAISCVWGEKNEWKIGNLMKTSQCRNLC